MDIIKVNGKDFPWEEDLTIQKVMEKNKYTFPKIVVKINDEVIENEEYSSRVVNKGDDVKIIHLLAGG